MTLRQPIMVLVILMEAQSPTAPRHHQVYRDKIMISSITNLLRTLWLTVLVWADGIAAGWRLARGALAAREEAGGLRASFGATLQNPANLGDLTDILRAFAPNLSLKRQLVKAYDNTGTAVVTRREDVLDVLNRDADFEVVYEPRMRKLTQGANFFLGMQPGADYERDTSLMRLAARQADVPEIVLPRATELAQRIVAECEGKLDLPPQLTLQVPWDMTDRYFGTGGPDPHIMQGWTTMLFWYLFGDLGADPDLERKAMEDASALRDYLDSAIAARKAGPTDATDMLNRCLAMQTAGMSGIDDTAIRNNLLGILIGAIPTISKASCLALDELLRRPDALQIAQNAALRDNDDLLSNCIWEALRFNPHNPIIYRRAVRDTLVGRSTLRQARIKEGQFVIAATQSAMFDRFDFDAPKSFRTDRPFSQQIIWGTGLHTCFGATINAAVIPAILKPILARTNLRRAEGDLGQIDTGGTPFPQHFHVEFDPV